MAIEAIKEREILNELAAKYELSPVMISSWKKELLENSAAAKVRNIRDAAKADDDDRHRRDNRSKQEHREP